MFERDSRRAEQLRRLYAGGRANASARRYARLWSVVLRLPLGFARRGWISFETVGRKSRRPVRIPLCMARHDGRWYLASMLGECNWTRNVRAAGGRAAILGLHRREVHLVEVPVAERAPILKAYVEQVPGARPHIPVDRRAPLSDFEAIAASHPVFAVAD